MNDDLISRQAVMKEFSDFVRRANNSDFAKTPTWNDAVSLVGSLPSAEVTLCHLDSPCEYQNADIALPSAQPEWNNHTVACLLADVFGDECACNFNGINEWLPEKCEVIDACPNPVGVACWEQYLKYRAERRTSE